MSMTDAERFHDQLLALAQACESLANDHDATAYRLDAEISKAQVWIPGVNHLDFTKSLDDARLLVPADHWWGVTQTCAPTSPMRGFGPSGNGIFLAQVSDWASPQPHTARNDHPAVALCAAALKARAAAIARGAS